MKLFYSVPLIIFILLGIGLSISLQMPHNVVYESPLIGKKLPEISLPSVVMGQPPVTGANYSGQMLLVNVFASWCRPCLVEHPLLMSLTKETGIPILGIAWKDTDEKINNWLAQHGNPYHAVGVDRDGKIAIELGITGSPETFLVDRRGVVIYRFAGAMTEEVIRSELMPRIKNLLP